MGRATSFLVRRFSLVAILLAAMFGTAVAANADSFTQNLTGGPGGVSQMLTVDYSIWIWGVHYGLSLEGAKGTGLDSGICGWIGECEVLAGFTGVGTLSGYNELVTTSWSGDDFSLPKFSLSYSGLAAAVPEESSLMEAGCILLLFLGMQAWTKCRSRNGSRLAA